MRQGGLVEVLDASRALRRRGHARARAASCSPRWRARGRCSSRCRRWSSPSELVPPRRVVTGIDRNRLALVLAVLARHARRRRRRRRRVRQRRRRRARRRARRRPRGRAGGRERGARRRAGRRRAAAACFGELGLTGELRPVGHPERRARGGRASSGSTPVIAPPATAAPTLARPAPARRARAALPPQRRRRAAAAWRSGASPGATRLSRSRRLFEGSCCRRIGSMAPRSGDELKELEASGAPARQGAGDGRARDRAARGDRQHPARAHRRADRDRRARGAQLPVLRRDQARHRLHAGVALPGGEDGRRHRPQRQRDEDRDGPTSS